MSSRDLGTLQPVPLRNIWGHEAHNFTPWLAENISQLAEVINIKLEASQREHWKSGEGFVDILARETESDRTVVIENQLEISDNDHFLRLMSYAASRKASTLIWIASEFTESHRSILSWLSGSGVEIYAVKVSAYRIEDAYAPWFEIIVSPEGATEIADARPYGDSLYARFYRPLTALLRIEGLYAIGGRQGGWTGRYRRFRSKALLETAGITYYTVLGRKTENCSAGLMFLGDQQQTDFHDAIFESKSDLEKDMVGFTVQWDRDPVRSYVHYVNVNKVGITEEGENALEATRHWMRDSLLRLRQVFEPKLEEIVESRENPLSD